MNNIDELSAQVQSFFVLADVAKKAYYGKEPLTEDTVKDYIKHFDDFYLLSASLRGPWVDLDDANKAAECLDRIFTLRAEFDSLMEMFQSLLPEEPLPFDEPPDAEQELRNLEKLG